MGVESRIINRPQRPRRPPPPQNRPPQQGAPQNRPPPRQPRPQPPQRPAQGRPVPQQNRLPPRNNPPPRNNQGLGQTQLGVPQSQVQGFRNNPPQQPLNNQNQIQSAPSKPSCTPGLISKQLKNCPGACPNHEWEGDQYIITWLVDDNRCSNFTGHEAEDYCKLQGGHAVSLDTTAKALHFIDVAIQNARRYFWTGGRIDHNAGVVTWPSGNRDGNEFCIGVLNNFYADGVKWHDVACHHRKPTI